jgi:hypothetical protein
MAKLVCQWDDGSQTTFDLDADVVKSLLNGMRQQERSQFVTGFAEEDDQLTGLAINTTRLLWAEVVPEVASEGASA